MSSLDFALSFIPEEAQAEMSPERESQLRGLVNNIGAAPSAVDMLNTVNPVDMQAFDRQMVSNNTGRGMTAAMSGLQGLTFGAGDELVGGLNATGAALTGGNIGEAYSTGRDRARMSVEAGREKFPGTALASEVAGAVASPGSLLGVGALKGAKTLPQRAATSGVLGALGGAAYGFNDGEGGLMERLDGASNNMLVAGGVGAAIPVVGAGIRHAARPLKARAAAKRFANAAPTAEEVIGQASDIYDDIRTSGVSFSASEVGGLRDIVKKSMRKSGIVTKNGKFLRPYRDAKATLEFLDDYAKTGMNGDDILAFRSMISDLTNSDQKKVRSAMGSVRTAFDKFAEPKIPTLKEANAMYARGSRAALLERAHVDASERASKNYTQAGMDHGLRISYGQILKKIRNGKLRGFTEDEIAAMERIVNGGAVENTLRRAGQAAPRNVSVAAPSYGVLGLLAQQAGVPPAAIIGAGGAAYGLGRGAGMLGGKMQSANSKVARAITATGQNPPALPAPKDIGLLERMMMLGAIPLEQ